MPDDLDRLNEIFRAHEESVKAGAQKPREDKLEAEAEAFNTAPQEKPVEGDAPRSPAKAERKKAERPRSEKDAERDFKPIRQRRDGKIGILGGLMYFVFVVSLSIIIACVTWMAASDVLALNKAEIEAEIILPESIFTDRQVEVTDEDGNVTGTRTIQIADIDYVSDLLKDAGIIEYRSLFKLFCAVSNADEKLDPGAYNLSTDFDYRALVKKMQIGSGAALTVDVTIPEGFTMEQVFERLEEEGVSSREDLYAAAADFTYNYSFLNEGDIGDASRLEGYLFPDTYQFYVGMQASSAINKFLQNFNSKLTADMNAQAAGLGLSFDEALIIASMIEGEAADDSERATIASVIYNRLEAGMALQIDATVQYALGSERKAVLTMEDLEIDSPYNTYIHTGLPPTAVGNPGLASINAALSPLDTNFYYYALDMESGSHRFFETYEEHQAFVATQDYSTME